MPYIITTIRPCPACIHGPNAGGEHRPDSRARVAVATVEEARTAVVEEIERHRPCAILHDPANVITEQGGKVGPLPGGTTIEVERLMWSDLADRAWGDADRSFPDVDAFKAQVLVDFNARVAA